MRDVAIVKEQRNELREELAKCIKRVKDMQVDEKSFKELSQYDQQVYVYLDRTVQKLRMQINALEFVLNEDTELIDPYKDRAAEKLQITKETVFNAEPGGYKLNLNNLTN